MLWNLSTVKSGSTVGVLLLERYGFKNNSYFISQLAIVIQTLKGHCTDCRMQLMTPSIWLPFHEQFALNFCLSYI